MIEKYKKILYLFFSLKFEEIKIKYFQNFLIKIPRIDFPPNIFT